MTTESTPVTPYSFLYGELSSPAFEGAAKRYREDRNNLVNGSPDQIASRELLLLQMRSAHAIRNNGYARTALDKYVTNLGAVKVIWKDAKGRNHLRMQDMWDEFAANPCLDGIGTLENVQNLWHSSIFSTGNAFTRLHIRRKGNPSTVPLKLEPIRSELHHLGYFGDTPTKPQMIRHGIGFVDKRPVSYFFRDNIYEDMWYKVGRPPLVGMSVTEIPADEILHIFQRDIPAQFIGIPFLASVLIPLYELDELMDATVARQKASQAISWIVKNTNPLNPVPVGVPTYVKDKEEKDKLVFKSQGTNVQYLNKNEDIVFHQGADIGANFVKLCETELRRIANAVKVPYHQLTGDTSGIDFSTLRAITIELRVRMEHVHQTQTIAMGLAPLTKYFKALASRYKNVGSAEPTYQMPRQYGVDELKDAQADLLEIQYGMATLESKLQERHTTFEEIVEDCRRREELKQFGIDFAAMPQSTNQSTNVEANAKSTSL